MKSSRKKGKKNNYIKVWESIVKIAMWLEKHHIPEMIIKLIIELIKWFCFR